VRRVKAFFTRRRLLRLGLGAVGLAVGTLLVVALREATLSTHDEPIEAASQTELVVKGRTNHGETGQTLDEMVEAQLQACRLEVASDLAGPIESMGDGRYRAALTPSLDETNRRQFRGCVEDWMIDGVLIDVVSLGNEDEDDDEDADEDESDDDEDGEDDDAEDR
jgi:hypothetical protein